MDKLEQMKLLKEAIRTNYKGSLSELLTPQPTQEVANTPEEQEQGLRGLEAEQMPDSMVFPDVAPNQSFNTMGMKAPIDLQKVDNQGHLVQSYENVPPGIKNLPTGPAEGMVIESPSKMKNGGYKGYKQKYQTAGVKEDNLVTPYDMDYVARGTNAYRDAYKQGKVASPIYDEKGEVTLNMQMLPEAVIESERSSGPSTLESAAYSQEVNPVIKGVQQSGREKVALGTLALPALTIGAAELGLGYGGQQVSKAAYNQVLKPTANKLLAPVKRYATNIADDVVNFTSKSPVGQSLLKTAKSKIGNVLSATYNTTKAMAVPAAYKTIGDQAVTEIKGEGTKKNRLDVGSKLADVFPQLSKVKDTYKIGKDLYNKDYDSAALRTVGVLGKKNPIVKYGTKLINKFTKSDVLSGDGLKRGKELIDYIPETVKNIKPLTLNQYNTPVQKPIVQAKPASLPTASKYGGYRKRYK